LKRRGGNDRPTGAHEADEAVATLESWRIPMRRLWALLAMLSVTPAGAETLDCAQIKSTLRPFELTIDWTGKKEGKDPLVMPMRRQVIRKPDETVEYEIYSPERFTRRTLNVAGFLLQSRRAGETTSRVVTYSIDVANDYFALGKPFDFNEVVKDADGTVASDLDTSVSFDGAGDFELDGCAYPITKIIASSHGSVRGAARSYRTEYWYSRDLKTSLYTRYETSDGFVVEIRARGLSTSFKPVE